MPLSARASYTMTPKIEQPATDNSYHQRGSNCVPPATGTATTLAEVVCQTLEKIVAESAFFARCPPNADMPSFKPQELCTGRIFGQGDFATVYELTCIKSSDTSNHSLRTIGTVDRAKDADSIARVDADQNNVSPIEDALKGALPELHHRNDELTLSNQEWVRTQCFREGRARFALKKLRSTLNKADRLDALTDLAFEAKFLSALSMKPHPNIIRLRAIVGEPGTDTFCLVLDRLECTLTQSIDDWKHGESGANLIQRLLPRGRAAARSSMVTRLTAAYDVARALNYLHRNKIVYRDLKPDNIGFDIRGSLKLFDFGLAKELCPEMQDGEEAGFYRLTPMCGTPRYMAPEVSCGQSYGLSSDVYSFGALTYHICTLKVPFAGMDYAKFLELVVVRAYRPKMSRRRVPAAIFELVTTCWSADPRTRPAMHDVCGAWPQIVLNLESKPSNEDLLNRSTHLLDKSQQSFRKAVAEKNAAVIRESTAPSTGTTVATISQISFATMP